VISRFVGGDAKVDSILSVGSVNYMLRLPQYEVITLEAVTLFL